MTLSGTLVDADGKPAPRVTVVVAEGPPALRFMTRMVGAGAPMAPQVLARATSDESGKFSVVMPDEAPEVAWRRTRLGIWAFHPNLALALRLIDRDWPQAGLPLSLALPGPAAVRLKITDAAYRPVAHVRVAPLRVAGHVVPDVLSERLAAETDVEGRVTLAGVRPADLDAVRVENEAIGLQWAGLPAQGRDTIVLLNLAPVGRITGQLTADDPRTVARRTLRFATWQVPGDEYSGGGLAEVATDDEGSFEVPALAAGTLTVELMEDGPPGPSPLTSTASERNPPSQPRAPVYLLAQTTGPDVEAAKTTTLEIPLRRAVQVIQEVRDEESHESVDGARVWIRSGGTGGTTGDTDASGRLAGYVLPGLVSSTLVRVPSSSYYDPAGGLRSGTEVTESTQPVPLKVIELARGVPLRGRVVDDNQRPLAGAEITGFWESPRKVPVHAWSNAQGDFTIDAVAAQATVLLWASHGESTSVQPVSARPQGEPATLIVGNKSCVSLDGRVVDAAGQPFAGAVVRVWAKEPQLAGFRYNDLGSALFGGSDRLITDAEGRFRTPPSLRPNATYSLEVEAPGVVSAETEAIEPDSWHTTRFADVVLHPAPRLRAVSGRVVDHQGRAVAGAAVSQSGDGPRRTQTTTDDEGRFQLGGIYDGPAYLFVRKDGFRLQGTRIATADKTCQITLRRGDEPAMTMTTLPPALSLDEQRDLAKSLVEPCLPMLREPVFRQGHRELLRTIARVDPAKGLEIADTILTNPAFKSEVWHHVALSLALTDLDEALVVIALVDRPFLRVQTCAFACDELSDAPTERRVKLLDEALVHARSEPDPGLRARELGQIAVRWLALGQRERGVSLLRRGQALAEALPTPNEANLRLTANRGSFAGMLARIDGPAALPLIEGFSGDLLNRFRTDMARGLADHDPAEAERLFRLIDPAPLFFRMRLAPVARMAAADPERAAHLARGYRDPCEQAFALGSVAHGLAAKDRAAAVRLLEEAYGLLDRASQFGVTQNRRRDAALTAAALLPVAEKFDPKLVEGYFWRALSLRQPWPAPSEPQVLRDVRLAELAAMIARYDRSIARDLLSPLAGRFGTQFMIGPAVIDPRWAAELVQAMPDVSAPPAKNPKLIRARNLAGWLGRPLRGFEGIWEQVYGHCDLRDPDTIDDIW
ncbi:MAG TPA: carboxypeptidase-like regulatory domain-containing protein [Pirellulales bacterium]|nr:carboxypeptidase-like regulatory domain-containing protein [Pirellulales bacterium]